MPYKLIATNKKAFRNFQITETWEAGISLVGAEVKSVRQGYVNFKDSFARIDKGQAFLHNVHINPYKEASYLNTDPDRPRRLLLHKKEIRKLEAMINEKGLTLVPTKIYINERGLVKVEVGQGKGKRLFDKRQTVKNRTIERGLRRMIRAKRS